MREEMLKKVMELFQKNFGVTPDKIDADTPLRESGLNSLGFIKLIVDLEDEFDVEFDDEDLEAGDKTINDMLDFLERNSKEASV